MYSGSEAHNKVSLPEFRAKRAHQVFFSDFRWFLLTKFPYEQTHERISRDVWKPHNFFDKTLIEHNGTSAGNSYPNKVCGSKFSSFPFTDWHERIDVLFFVHIWRDSRFSLCFLWSFAREISARLTEKWTFLAHALCLTDAFLWHQKSEQAQTLEVNTFNNIVTMVQVKKKKS